MDRPEPADSTRKPLVHEGLRSAWYRRDWVTVLAGLAVIMLVNFTVFEIALHALHIHPTNAATHLAYESRLIVGMLLTTIWVGWRAQQGERKLASALERASADEAELAEQRWRVDQAEGLAAFSRGLAHELRTPLNDVALHGTVVKRAASRVNGADGESLRSAAEVITAEAQRMGDLIDDYLSYARTETELTLHHEELALAQLTSEAIAPNRAAFEARGVCLDLRWDAPLPRVYGDRVRLAQAIRHVVEHALEALPNGGHVDVALEAAGGQVVLSVTDDGPGFPDPKAVFRPFFTTGARGAGFGFAVVRDIVRAHRGEVAASNVGERGARVELRLPVGERR